MVISGRSGVGILRGWRKLSQTSIANGVEQLAVTEVFSVTTVLYYLGNGLDVFPFYLCCLRWFLFFLVFSSAWSDRLLKKGGWSKNRMETFNLYLNLLVI